MRNIIITDHAIERFKERVAIREYDNEEIKKRLQVVACKGKVVCNEPGNAKRKQFENIYLLTSYDKDGNEVVLTCLGDKKRVSWYTKENKNRRRYC